AAAQAHLADNNPGRAASLFSTLASTFKSKKWSHPQLAEIEKKADELYKRSIQSKLLGISRGSSALDPDTVPDGPRGSGTLMFTDVEQPTSALAAGTAPMTAVMTQTTDRPTTKMAQL